MTDMITLAEENGFSHIAYADMAAFVPMPEVRAMCAADRCGKWNNNWACPPGCGSLEAAAEQIRGYKRAILVQTTGELADELDYEGMQRVSEHHKRSFSNFARQTRLVYPDCLALTAGTCGICKKCTYPDRPCRFPSRRLSSMEAYGLWVSDICTRSGLGYNYGERTMTYTSCVLYNEE